MDGADAATDEEQTALIIILITSNQCNAIKRRRNRNRANNPNSKVAYPR